MSCQKGNVSRSRGQKHQNVTAFKNDKYGASVQVKVSACSCKHCVASYLTFKQYQFCFLLVYIAVALFKILLRLFV